MYRSLVFKMLNGISGPEVKQFRAFLRLNGNSRKAEIKKRLAEAFFQNKKALHSGQMTEEMLVRGLFPSGKSPTPKEITTAKNELVNQVKSFLTWQELNEGSLEIDQHCMNGLRKRGMPRQATKLFEKMKGKWKGSMHRNARHALWGMDLTEMEALLGETSQVRKPHQLFNEALDHLDRFYLLSRMRYECAQANLLLFQHTPPVGFSPQVGLMLGSIPAPDPLICMYKAVFKTLHNDSPAYYELVALLKQYPEITELRELLELYQYALNFCLRQRTSHFRKEAGKLYRHLLEKEILLEQGKLASLTYKNIAMIMLRENELAWVKDFQQDYQDRLQEDYNQNARNFVQAILLFWEAHLMGYRERNRKSMGTERVLVANLEEEEPRDRLALFRSSKDYIDKILKDFRDIFYGLDGRCFELMIFFELGHYDIIGHKCEALRAAIRRKYDRPLSSAKLKGYATFNHFFKNLNKHTISRNRNRIERLTKLGKDIEEAGSFPGKWWFINKLAQEVP